MTYEPTPSEVTQFETATLTPYLIARVVTSLLDGLRCAQDVKKAALRIAWGQITQDQFYVDEG